MSGTSSRANVSVDNEWNKSRLISAHPTFGEVQARLAVLRRSRVRNLDFEELKTRVDALTKGFTLSSPTLDERTKVFRGVVWSERPTKLAQLSYPPAHVVRTFGRANRPGRPMFYGSIARSAPFFEIRATAGALIVISRWSLKTKLFFNNVGYTDSVLRRSNSARALTQWWQERTTPAVEKPANRLIHRFLASEFARMVEQGNEHEYKMSAAIAENLLGNLTIDHREEGMPTYEGWGGLLYPSLAMRANTDNVAILPEVVDRFMRFEQAEYIRVDSVNEDFTYTVTALDFANSVSSDGTIEWKGRHGQWTIPAGRIHQVAVEDGQWVVRDEAGQILDHV